MQLIALQLEQQFSFFQPFVRIFERHPHAAIPHNHRAGAVIPLRDDSFEVAVLEWVVFHFDGEAFVGGIGGRSLGNGPRFEDAVHLEPQIPMQSRCIVHVHDEQAALARDGLGN